VDESACLDMRIAMGQPKLEIFPESDHDYFLKVVDAQITFETHMQSGFASESIPGGLVNSRISHQ
jgi:hypothetical protein